VEICVVPCCDPTPFEPHAFTGDAGGSGHANGRDLPYQARVFEQYRSVLERNTPEAAEHLHRVHGVEDVYRHEAVRLGDGVAAVLCNLSAAGLARRPFDSRCPSD
jgi:hypothetical protein